MQEEQDLLSLVPEDFAFVSPGKKKSPSIAELCEKKSSGQSLVVFDLDGTLTYLHSYSIEKKQQMDKIQNDKDFLEFMVHNIKFLPQLVEVVKKIKRKGHAIALATCCENQNYVKAVVEVICQTANELLFDAMIIGKKDRDHAIIALVQELNSQSEEVLINHVVLIDDEQENIRVVNNSGKKFVKTILVKSPTSNQFLLDLGQYFSLNLSFSLSDFDSTQLLLIYRNITSLKRKNHEKEHSSSAAVEKKIKMGVQRISLSVTSSNSLLKKKIPSVPTSTKKPIVDQESDLTTEYSSYFS